jgi:hypothetical protein
MISGGLLPLNVTKPVQYIRHMSLTPYAGYQFDFTAVKNEATNK